MGGPCDPSDAHNCANNNHHHRVDPACSNEEEQEASLPVSELIQVSSSGEMILSKASGGILHGHGDTVITRKERYQDSSTMHTTGSLVPTASNDNVTSHVTTATPTTTLQRQLQLAMLLQQQLQPPPSRWERFRDAIFRLLEGRFFSAVSIAVLVLVIADGALFFFLLMGWQRMCRPRRDCEPRNEVYNVSIQFLNILFTYTAIMAMPWRVANFWHLIGLSCPRRSNELGRNLYGLPDPDVWFHIPNRKRLGITVIFLCNCLFQFINHGTRVYFYNYELQDKYPGNIWTSAFFAASFLCAGIAATWLTVESARLRKAFPGKFGLGPRDMVQQCWSTSKDRAVSWHKERQNTDLEATVVDKSTITNSVSVHVGENSVEHPAEDCENGITADEVVSNRRRTP
jgi:Protein of unknown function (DUF2985)